MNKRGIELLVIEDEAPQRKIIAQILQQAGYEIHAVGDAEEALLYLKETVPDLILCDWRLPGMSGGELLAEVKKRQIEASFVVMTAYGSISHAVQAVRDGADDYLAKPFEKETLLLAIQRALKTRRLEYENIRLRQEIAQKEGFGQIIGRSSAIQSVFKTLKKIADTDATVLVTGESGTGKELVARSLHSESSRKNKPFVAINCAAIPETLIESELFGHEKGAFTGAHKQRKGKFEEAESGTLFLDEIAAMSLPLQAKLLRVLQEKKFARLGGTGEIGFDVRIVAASNKELSELVSKGEFREDLYYRLNVVPIFIPPLRKRIEDVPLLTNAFLKQFAQKHKTSVGSIPASVMRALMEYSWPGNVRELSNVIERLLLLAENGTIKKEDLPPEIREPLQGAGCPFQLPPEGIDWEKMESSILQQALDRAGGNKTSAAKLLGLGYKAFLYRIEKYSLLD